MDGKSGMENKAFEDTEVQFTVRRKSDDYSGGDDQNPSSKALEATRDAESVMTMAEAATAHTGWWTPQRRIMKDVAVLSVSYLLLFTAFKGAANLQSSVNAEGGLGTSALMAYYAGFIISSIFLPAVMIRKMGCKWTMAACALAFAPFMAANLRAEFYTLLPGALVAGAGAGPAWCALSTYTSLAGERHARAAAAVGGEADVEATTAKLYSLFYTVYQLNQVSGNLLSSLVLSAGVDDSTTKMFPETNATFLRTDWNSTLNETSWNEMTSNETTWNETTWNETTWNETNWNETWTQNTTNSQEATLTAERINSTAWKIVENTSNEKEGNRLSSLGETSTVSYAMSTPVSKADSSLPTSTTGVGLSTHSVKDNSNTKDSSTVGYEKIETTTLSIESTFSNSSHTAKTTLSHTSPIAVETEMGSAITTPSSVTSETGSVVSASSTTNITSKTDYSSFTTQETSHVTLESESWSSPISKKSQRHAEASTTSSFVTLVTESAKMEAGVVEAQVCGAALCGEAAAGALPHAPPPAERLNALCGAYLACVLLSVLLLATGVGNLSRESATEDQLSALDLLAATVRLLRRRRLLLLLPVFVFFGAEKAFVGAEFTAGYVSCVSGVASIGFVMICYGLTNSCASAAAGWLGARAGRRRGMAVTVALHGALLAALLAWAPRPGATSARAALFALATVWGVVDGLWLVQINSLVSLLFPGEEEAAFSNYHLWESAGYIVAYGYSAHLCIYVKLYVLVALLVVGAACYSVIEIQLLRRTRKELKAST